MDLSTPPMRIERIVRTMYRPRCACGWASPNEYAGEADARSAAGRHQDTHGQYSS